MGGPSDDTPDEEWVFDESFVAGGIREDSLRAPRPPESARNPMGNLRGPRDWTPRRADTGPAPRFGRLWAVLTLGVVVAIVVAGSVYGTVEGGRHGPTPIAAAPSVSPSAGHGTRDPQVNGITPATPIGTCLSGTAAPGTDLDVHQTACRERHDYELVARERASGSDDTYPDESYWHGPVAQRCYADVLRYIGRPRDEWPDHLDSTRFIPRHSGWATGDRDVYCLAQWQPAATGSVAHLPAAHRPVVRSSTPTTARPTSPTPTTSRPATTLPAPDDPGTRTLTGRLFVQTNGPDVCLSIRSAGYTGPVVSTAAGLSWRASVDDAGRPDESGSGIATASAARADNIRWHAGDRVRLTGSVIDGYGDVCGASEVFGFVAVRSTG